MVEKMRHRSFNIFANTDGLLLRPMSDCHCPSTETFLICVPTNGGYFKSWAFRSRWQYVGGHPALFIHLATPGVKTFMPAEEWFLEHYDTQVFGQGQLKDYLQLSGKSFNYEGLPTELHFEILQAAIGPTVWPNVSVPKLLDTMELVATSQQDCPATVSRHDLYDEWRMSMTQQPRPTENLESLLDAESFDWPSYISVAAPSKLWLKHRIACPAKPFEPTGLKSSDEPWLRGLMAVSKSFSKEVQKMVWLPTVKMFNSRTTTVSYTHLTLPTT